MKLGLKQVKKIFVYYQGHDQPFAKVYSVILNQVTKEITAYRIKTLSLIPISMLVDSGSILSINNKKMVLKEKCNLFYNNAECRNNVEIVDMDDMPCVRKLKIRDIRFDFEIGEMTDLILSKNIFSSKFHVDAKDVQLKEDSESKSRGWNKYV